MKLSDKNIILFMLIVIINILTYKLSFGRYKQVFPKFNLYS